MLDENSIKERLEILNSDIAKVQENLVTLEKQTKDGIAMLNALNGAKQQCISFLKDLNDDEPDDSDSGDVGNNADSNIPQSKQKNAAMGLI